MLHGKFHYHTILGCEVTDFKYVTVYGRGDHFIMCLDHLHKATMADQSEDCNSISSLSKPHGSVKLIL